MVTESLDEINLRTLKRIDPCVENIIASASYVALYHFNQHDGHWNKLECEGSLHVYRKGQSTIPPCTSTTNSSSNAAIASSSSSLSTSSPFTAKLHFGFVILNRVSTTNHLEVITKAIEFEQRDQFLMYRNTVGQVYCLWFHSKSECEKVYKWINHLTNKRQTSFDFRNFI